MFPELHPRSIDSELCQNIKTMYREVGLRQQDMSLLCQLWSLHESIQEYKGSCQDMSAASNADGSYNMENGFFDEEDEYYQDTSITPNEHMDLNASVPKTLNNKWMQDSIHMSI
ncbi:UNVERIFIED_CONTAM: hypothetical protein FKN15_044265 [Acipenser sinensis]